MEEILAGQGSLSEYVAVSHRWIQAGAPDPDGKKLKELQGTFYWLKKYQRSGVRQNGTSLTLMSPLPKWMVYLLRVHFK